MESAPLQFVDRFVQLGMKLLDCQKYLNLRMIITAFIETLAACAGSCFPAIDTYTDDEDEVPQTEQNKIKQN